MTIQNLCMQKMTTWKLCMHDNGRLTTRGVNFYAIIILSIIDLSKHQA